MTPIRIKTSSDRKIWFISDLHVGHDKPFILGPRKYATVNEAIDHTFKMIAEHIGPNDIVFNLGDAVIGAGDRSTEYARRVINIPCATQYFIWGNHNAGMQQIYSEELDPLRGVLDSPENNDFELYPIRVAGTPFVFAGHRLEVTIDGQALVLDHYPIESWNGLAKGAWMINGHCHRNMKDNGSIKRLDVGWEWKRRPVEWAEIVAELGNRKGLLVDHHGKDDALKKFLE